MTNEGPLREEYSVLWRTGLCDEGEEVRDTAAVCCIGLDSGDTTHIRTFYSGKDEKSAEDHLLEWLEDLPLLQEADDIHIKIFMNYSPQAATSVGLVTFINDLEGQDKSVAMTLRFVRLYKVHDESEAKENKDGLRLLKRSKVTIDVVRECDWSFLMNVLTNRETKRRLGRSAEDVKKELQVIFNDPKDQHTHTEPVTTVEAETMTDEVEEDVQKEEDSSSDDEE